MVLRVLLWSFIIVMIFRFIARFVFPILNITRLTQDRLRQMQQQMEDMQQKQSNPPPAQQQTQKVKEGDYIDYEEVK